MNGPMKRVTPLNYHPLLISTPLIGPILSGVKTQTRRLIVPQPDDRGLRTTNVLWEDYHGREIKCPFGAKNHVLWVKETFCNINKPNRILNGSIIQIEPVYYYKADCLDAEDYDSSEWKWTSSRFMPFAAHRIELKVTDIAVERLHDITEEDAQKEGVEPGRLVGFGAVGLTSYREGFMLKWLELHGQDNLALNPWIWKISFERIMP